MKTANAQTRSFGEETPEFNLVIVYEDDESLRFAESVFATVAPALDGIDVRSSAWKFDIMQISSLRQTAALDAAAADLVMVAARSPASIPVEIQQWAMDWRNCHSLHSNSALAVLISEPPAGDSWSQQAEHEHLVQFMRNFAAQLRVEFFTKTADFSEDEYHAGSPCR